MSNELNLSVKVVEKLPNIDDAEKGTIYIVHKKAKGIDICDEYLFVDYDRGFVLLDRVEIIDEILGEQDE